MASYLTASQAETRLYSRFNIETTVTDGDVEIASDELDAGTPFIGTKLVTDGTQEREFPRSVNPDGTTNEATTPPDAVLDWVALAAYQLTSDDSPAVTSASADGVSLTFASADTSPTERRMAYLLSPYYLKVGERA